MWINRPNEKNALLLTEALMPSPNFTIKAVKYFFWVEKNPLKIEMPLF